MEKIRQILSQLKYHKYPFLLCFMFSFIPFYWLQGHPVGWGDGGLNAFFYNAPYQFNANKYVWWPQVMTGAYSAQTITQIPLSGIFSLFTLLGLSNYIQQATIYSLIIFVSMIFMYLFVCQVFYYEDDKRIFGTISAVFYAFNPLVMFNYWHFLLHNVYLLPFIPIVLYLFYRGLKELKFIYIFFTALIISCFSIAFLNPAFVIPVLMMLALLFAFQIILSWGNKDRTKKIIIYTAILIIFVLLLNAWFILPFISIVKEQYRLATTLMDPLSTMIASSHGTSLSGLFRGLPLKLNAGILAYKNPKWLSYYREPAFIFLGTMMSIIIISPLLSRRKDRNVLFFTFLLIVGIFFCLGVNSPFGFIFKWMFVNIPFFQMFRIPYNKFMPFLLVSYAVLFGVGITSIFNWLKYRFKVGYAKFMVMAIMFLICGVQVFPLWTGSVVNVPITIRGNKISSFIEVPPYYPDIANYFRKDLTDYRILSLPLRPYSLVGLDWEYGYDGPDVMSLLYKHKTISNLFDNYYPSAKILSKIESLNSINIYNILKLLGIKYIVIQNDVDIIRGNYGGKILMPQQKIETILENIEMPFVNSYGRLDLYKIPDDYFLPLIYPASGITIVTGGVHSLLALSKASYLDEHPALVFTDQQDTDSLRSIANQKHSAFNSKILITDGNLFFHKNDRKENENLLEEKSFSYLFYVDRDKAMEIAGKINISNYKKAYNNPFNLQKNTFYVPIEGEYSIQAYLNPKRTFKSDAQVINSSRLRAPIDGISGWAISQEPPDDELSVLTNEDGLHIKIDVGKDREFGGNITLEKKFDTIRLKEYPYMVFSYAVKNGPLKDVYIDIWLKDDNGNVHPKKITLQPVSRTQTINLYEKALEVFKESEVEILQIDMVRIAFNKNDGVGEYSSAVKRVYEFTLRNASFQNFQPVIARFDDNLSGFSVDKYYYYDTHGELREAGFWDEIPYYVSYIFKLEMQKYLDLTENPVLTVTFPGRTSQQISEKLDSSYAFRVSMSVDFDGDNKEDADVDIIDSPVPHNTKGKSLLMNISSLQEIKKRFPDRKYYNLLGLSISFPDDQHAFYQEIENKKLFRYKTRTYQLSDFKIESPLLKMDDKVYRLPVDFDNNGNNGQLLIEYKGIKLSRGEHKIDSAENETIKVNMVEISPEVSRRKSEGGSNKPPKVEFRKINPTRYVVDVSNAKGPFPLVFSESFHGGWKAYSRESKLRGDESDETLTFEPSSALWSAWNDRDKRVEIKNHFVVNGYANGWIVPVEQKPDGRSWISGKGDNFQIVLEFVPQRLFEAGLIIAAITLFGCIGYLGLGLIRQRGNGAHEG